MKQETHPRPPALLPRGQQGNCCKAGWSGHRSKSRLCKTVCCYNQSHPWAQTQLLNRMSKAETGIRPKSTPVENERYLEQFTLVVLCSWWHLTPSFHLKPPRVWEQNELNLRPPPAEEWGTSSISHRGFFKVLARSNLCRKRAGEINCLPHCCYSPKPQQTFMRSLPCLFSLDSSHNLASSSAGLDCLTVGTPSFVPKKS